MSVITSGKTFSNGEQLSADKLNLMLTGATFNNSAVDLTSTLVDSNGAIVVRDGGITPAKLSTGAPSWDTNGIVNGNAFRAAQGAPNGADASTTGFAFGADGDTGMFSIGTSGAGAGGPIAFYANNEELMRMDTNGLVKLKGQDNALDDWWGGPSNTPAIFTPHGFFGSNGSFAVSLFCNGYRNTSGGFTSLGANGNTNASGIDLLPTGTTIFRNGAPTGTSVTESMRIDSDGRLLIGASSYGNGLYDGNSFKYSTTGGIRISKNTTAASNQVTFHNPNGQVGFINSENNATLYSTSSDYRLKEDIIEMDDSLERLKALKPCNFAWKADGSRTDGFIAHEAQEVVPEAVTGTKDAVDDEGNPDYQGIDQSKLVPLLTKALQEAVAKIESLEARVTELES